MRWARSPAVVALVMLVAVALATSSAYATTLVVDTTSDSGAPNPSCTEPCSLRQAIADANGSIEKENRVEVPPGTYVLTQGPLQLLPQAKTKETVIGRASHADEVVISGGGKQQVMTVGSAAGGPVGESVLALVEVTDGQTQNQGAGIRVEPGATLNLVDASVDGNVAKEFGGGIYVGGSLDMVDSVVARNEVTGGSGGGVDAAGPAAIADSTIADNRSAREGGGVYDEVSLKLTSATIAANKAGEGGGGGLAGKTVEAFNSIVAANTPNDCAAKIEDAPVGHNLADDASCNLISPGDKETPAGLVEEAGLPLLTDNGGPTETIALQSTSAAIGGGDSTTCIPVDQRGVERPKGSCDIGAFQFVAPASGSGGAQQQSPQSAQQSSTPGLSTVSSPPPPPVLGRTGNAAPVSGKVLIELPGTSTFVALGALREIPFGTVIDATHGHVAVTTAGPHGATQTGEFFEGEFVLTQGRNGVVTATLAGGDFAVCPTARERSHTARAYAAHASGSHVVRKLWANAHGSFSTKGNYAAGAVAGTEWLTEDLCDGTSIRVTRDKVLVTNLVHHRHLIVKSGHSYLAKAP